MIRYLTIAISLISLLACETSKTKSKTKEIPQEESQTDLIIAFGSCNNQRVKTSIWKAISDTEPDLFIWGGDIVYSDTQDMNHMREAYNAVLYDSGYVALTQKTEITGTWDDHDYFANDKAGIPKGFTDEDRQGEPFVGRDPVLEMYPGAYETLEERAPNLWKKVLLPGTGHWVQQEAPEETNAALLNFLGGL